jgi:cystathionine gamma-synthase
MVSFEIRGGEASVRAFVDSLGCFSLAESLGGVESLVCHPPSMTHAPVSAAALAKAGIRPNLVRLSVGIECGDDLVADVTAALEQAARAGAARPLAVAGC